MPDGADAVRLHFDGPIAIVSLRPPREAQRRERRDGRAPVRDPGGAARNAGAARADLARRTARRSRRAATPRSSACAPKTSATLEFIERGHAGTQRFFTLPFPIIVALKGWVIGGSFERALLCDLRVAGESARMRLPEILHGVVPDSGGTARLFQIAGHGLVADLALTGRVLDAAGGAAPRHRLARGARRRAGRCGARDRARDRERARLHGGDVPAHAAPHGEPAGAAVDAGGSGRRRRWCSPRRTTRSSRPRARRSASRSTEGAERQTSTHAPRSALCRTCSLRCSRAPARPR